MYLSDFFSLFIPNKTFVKQVFVIILFLISLLFFIADKRIILLVEM